MLFHLIGNFFLIKWNRDKHQAIRLPPLWMKNSTSQSRITLSVVVVVVVDVFSSSLENMRWLMSVHHGISFCSSFLVKTRKPYHMLFMCIHYETKQFFFVEDLLCFFCQVFFCAFWWSTATEWNRISCMCCMWIGSYYKISHRSSHTRNILT